MTTWVKVFNSMPTHPKVLRAGDRAAWLFVCGLCYSNEHLTDGHISHHALPVIAPGVKGPERLAAVLVDVGLWHEVDGGWQIHDYKEVQRSAAEIRQRRAKDAARKESARTTRSAATRSPHGNDADSARTNDGVRTDPRACDRGRSQDVDVDVEIEAKASSRRAERAEDKSTEDDSKLCKLLAELAKQRNPKFQVRSKGRWLTDMRLLRERDHNQPAEIERALRWVFTNPGRDARFWADVIQSPGNLREHFPRVWAQMIAPPVAVNGSPPVEDSASFLARRRAMA